VKGKALSLSQIRKLGIEALAKALGPIGMVRFIQQFEVGRGDYTKERTRRLHRMSIQNIVQGIEEKRLQ
jgi:hypothetical protein